VRFSRRIRVSQSSRNNPAESTGWLFIIVVFLLVFAGEMAKPATATAPDKSRSAETALSKGCRVRWVREHDRFHGGSERKSPGPACWFERQMQAGGVEAALHEHGPWSKLARAACAQEDHRARGSPGQDFQSDIHTGTPSQPGVPISREQRKDPAQRILDPGPSGAMSMASMPSR